MTMMMKRLLAKGSMACPNVVEGVEEEVVAEGEVEAVKEGCLMDRWKMLKENKGCRLNWRDQGR